MNRWIRIGLRELARELGVARRGLPDWVPSLLGVGLIKRFTRPAPALIYSQKLKPGKGVRIKMVGSDEHVDVIG